MTDLIFIAGLLVATVGIGLLSLAAALIFGGLAASGTALWFEVSA